MTSAYELLVKIDPKRVRSLRDTQIDVSARVPSASGDYSYRVTLTESGELVIRSGIFGVSIDVENLLDVIDALVEARG